MCKPPEGTCQATWSMWLGWTSIYNAICHPRNCHSSIHDIVEKVAFRSMLSAKWSFFDPFWLKNRFLIHVICETSTVVAVVNDVVNYPWSDVVRCCSPMNKRRNSERIRWNFRWKKKFQNARSFLWLKGACVKVMKHSTTCYSRTKNAISEEQLESRELTTAPFLSNSK